MLTIDKALNKLQTSAFRAGFRLKEKDKAYVREKGMDTIRCHVQDFVRKQEQIEHGFRRKGNSYCRF